MFNAKIVTLFDRVLHVCSGGREENYKRGKGKGPIY